MSDFYLMTRAAYAKLSRPVAKASLRMGLTPDSITIIGTAGTVIAALTLFPIGQLWWGAFAVFVFVLADMLDGAMARERGFGTPFGGVLDATCDRIADGAIFCGLLWWAAFGVHSASLAVATMISLVTSQVISYIKARAEANGLKGDGGFIERPGAADHRAGSAPGCPGCRSCTCRGCCTSRCGCWRWPAWSRWGSGCTRCAPRRARWNRCDTTPPPPNDSEEEASEP